MRLDKLSGSWTSVYPKLANSKLYISKYGTDNKYSKSHHAAFSIANSATSEYPKYRLVTIMINLNKMKELNTF